jgi:cytochrome c oxidase assembly factor CtaG
MKSFIFWDVILRRQVEVERRFGGTYRLVLAACFMLASYLIYSLIRYVPQMSVDSYQTTRCCIPEDRTIRC